MLQYHHLSRAKEVKMNTLPSSASHGKEHWERRNSLRNDEYYLVTQNDSLRKDFERVYNDREYFHQQRDELNEKLENSSSCQVLSRLNIFTPPFCHNTECHESDIVASLNTKIRYLKQLVRNRDDTISHLQDTSVSERTDFRFNIQSQNSALREKDDLLNVQKYQMQCTTEEFQRANDYLHEMVHDLEEMLHRDGTRLNNANRPIIFKLVLRRDDRLFNIMNQLQLKVSEVHEKEKKMASSIQIQNETIFYLEKLYRQFQENLSKFEREDEYERKEKLSQHTLNKTNQREDEFRERISSVKTYKMCHDEQVKLLKERVECLEKEKWELNEKMSKMAKEHELGDRLRQSSDDVMRTKDSDCKYLEEMLERRKVSIDVLEKKVQEMNSKILEQSVRHRHDIDSFQGKKSDIEERNATLKKKNHHLEAEVERLNEKNRGLEETLNRKKKEISDTNEQYVKAVKEKDAISSQVCDLRQRTNKTYDSEAETYKTITSLKAELKHMDEETKLRDAKVKNLEKMLENKNINLGERINQLENKIKEKDDQLSAQSYQHHQVVTRLHVKESDSEETIFSLKKELRHLEAEVQRCNGQNRELEETLDRRKNEISESNERYSKAVKEKNIISSQVSDLQQRTNKTYDSEAESNKTIRELKVEIKNMDEEMKLWDSKAKHLEKELQNEKKNSGERISQLQNKIQEKDDQLSAQSIQHQQVVRRLREKEAALEETIASLKKKIHDLEVDALQFISKIKDLEDQLKKTKLVAKAEQTGDVPAMENMITDLKQQLKQARTKLRETEAELNETKTRLSKAMGERLTDNNPNITDLGDKNRPTKLAERFAELYDNQWTDAFDILEKKFDTEEKAIEALLHILQDAMSFCKSKEREQMEELRRVLVFADKTVPRGEAIDIQRLFKENRKAVASSAVENLLHAYEAHIRRSADERIQMATDVKSYAKECLEICWLMTVQDPPVVFAPLLKKGVPFNNELFRPYTKSGSIVAFVVWPALLLHENGPVLAKGVAQGAGKP